MNRRSFLKTLPALMAAMGTIHVEPAPWILGKARLGADTVPGASTFQITFPDGTVWSVQGFIKSSVVNGESLAMSTSDLVIQPTGKPTLLGGEPDPERINGPVTVLVDGKPAGEVLDLEMPTMERHVDVTLDDVSVQSDASHNHYVLGALRMGEMHMKLEGTWLP